MISSFTSLPLLLLAEADPTTAPSATSTASSSGLVFWLVLLAAMALAPFVLTMVTSFAKLVIVGGIVRHALGTQQIPPNTVITGLALILTIHIMSPVGMRMYAHFQQNVPAEPNPTTGQVVRRVAVAAEGPMREFLLQHSHPQNIALFEDLHERLRQSSRDADTDKAEAELSKDPLINDAMRDATVLTPAFMLSQLTEAFQIGFLLFVPFLIIDLVVSNVLMAMGMQMMSPVTVSMPLKLLLFVLIDGWTLVMRGLVLSYT
jgi:type III secretion protein R